MTTNATRGQRILLVSSLLLLVDSFLPWEAGSFEAGRFTVSLPSKNGWEGVGILAGLLVVALLVWEIGQLTGRAGAVPVPAATTSALLAGGILLATVARVIAADDVRRYGAWFGLVLAFAVGYGGWIRLTENRVPRPESAGRSEPA